MDVHYPTSSEPATADYVLEVISDLQRHDSGGALSFDTTVEEWRDAGELLEWRELGHAYNAFWDITATDDEWQAVLEPPPHRRLADVCRFIAQRAARPVIRPVHLLGNQCAPAGAFLTIRSLLHEAGAPVAEIAPSTLLAPYTRQFAEVFLTDLTRLAPGALPRVRIDHPVYDRAVWGMLLALIGIPLGMCGLPLLTVASLLLFGGCYLAATFAAQQLPARVEFGSLRTFRDLAICVASARTAATSGGR